VVVRKGGAGGDVEACGFESGEELGGPGEAAKGRDGAGDRWDSHAAVEAPDGAFPTKGAEIGVELGLVGRDGEDGGAAKGTDGFAEVAGREEAVVPVLLVEEEDVDVAVKLAVLEAVVEEVDVRGVIGRGSSGVLFGEEAGVVALAGDVDGDIGVAGDEDWLVAEVDGSSIRADAAGKAGVAAIAAGEHIDADAATGEGLGEGDGKGGFAGSAGGKIPDADDCEAETTDGFDSGAKAKGAERQGEAIGGDKGEEGSAHGMQRHHAGRPVGVADSMTRGEESRICRRASMLRAVAPACWRKTWRARSPMAAAEGRLRRISFKDSANFSREAMRRASWARRSSVMARKLA
jgi:hypothetical protein